MKRFSLCVCVLSMVAFASQANAAKKIYLGVLGGVNFADLSGTDDASSRTCFSGGGLIEMDMNESFGVRAELLYTQKGAEQEVNELVEGEEETKLKLKYVEIPILFVASLNKTETTDFNVFAGPSIGFNIGAEAESGGINTDLGDYVNGTEFGAVIGAEFEHINPSVIWFGDVRFAIGATSIFDQGGFEIEDIKNRGFSILVGAKLPLGSN